MVLKWAGQLGLLSCLLMPVSSWASVAVDPAWHLSEQEVATVSAGATVTHAQAIDEYVRNIDAFLLIKAPAKLIFSLITDFDSLSEFMPNLERVEVLEQSASGALVNYELALPFGVKKRYRLQLSYNQDEEDLRMSWNLVPWPELAADETIVATSGSWLLKPTADQAATLLVYNTRTDPGEVPFGLGWIVDYLSNETVVELLENTKERAEQQWLESNKN